MKDTLFDVLVLESSFFIISQERQSIFNQQFGTSSDYFNNTYLSDMIEVSLKLKK